jgi:hypothetical protein
LQLNILFEHFIHLFSYSKCPGRGFLLLELVL